MPSPTRCSPLPHQHIHSTKALLPAPLHRNTPMSTPSSSPSQALPNTGTASPASHGPPDFRPGLPLPSGPGDPSPQRLPPFPPSRAPGTLLSPWLPPQTFLSLLLSLWREQHSLPARPARPAAWLSRGVSPHPPSTARRESLAQETGSLGQSGPPLCPGPRVLGEEGRGYLQEARGPGP